MGIKSIIAFSFTLVLFVGFKLDKETNKQDSADLRELNQTSFKKGEFLEYEVSYGFFDAAKATLEIKQETKDINGRKTMHVIGKGRSNGALRWFFKVDDRYETYLDEDAMIPWKFVRHVREGGYKLDRSIHFDHYNNKATVFQKDTKDYQVKPNTQDLLSAFYYARTLELRNAKIGQEFIINTFFDREMYPLKIKFLGKEKIKTILGEFNSLKFRPMVEKGRVFKEEEDMTLWLSDDANKVPIRLKTNLLVGSIKMDLANHKNLAVPLNEIKE
jgi:hypothetical protein